MKVAALILAAGKSSRMGKVKQLLPWGGDTLLGSTINLYTKSMVDEIIVVVGHRSAEIRGALTGKPVRWVENKEYHLGMSTSLKAGIAALSQEVEAAFLALGDSPFVKQETIERMLQSYGKDNSKIVVPFYKGIRGNPILIGAELFPELLTVEGDIGAREVLKRHEPLIYKLHVKDPGVLQDVDTWEEYLGYTRA